jgi:DNA-binding IclR family transcriptional regulator
MPKVLTVEKCLDLLELIAATHEEGLGTREIARRLELNPTTVHNLATTLLHRGYLVQDKQGKHFHLGGRFLLLARSGALFENLALQAEPFVHRLNREMDESILLAMLEDGRPLTLTYMPSSQALRVHEPHTMGPRAYCTAVGKLLLASMAPQQLNNYLKEYPPKPYSEKTVMKPEAIRTELARIRENGYSETHDEFAPGISAYAIPVLDPTGKTVAALGASAPTFRLRGETINKTMELLHRYAGLIAGAWFRN